jgi:hypothetical protein
MVAILSTPKRIPAFTEPGEIVGTQNGPMCRTVDGRMIGRCGEGWGLMTQDQAAEYREKWRKK